MKAADYGAITHSVSAFVTTNSINQGQQAAILWPAIFATGHEIAFAHTSFKWANLASQNAGVTVVIVGISNAAEPVRKLFSVGEAGETLQMEAENINAYLVAGPNVIARKASKPLNELAGMNFGNKPVDGGSLLLTRDEVESLGLTPAQEARFIRRIYGSAEFIRGLSRYCLWIEDQYLDEALAIPSIRTRAESVRAMRLASEKTATRMIADVAHRFGEVRQSGSETAIVVPSVSSESRGYLPVGYMAPGTIVSNLALRSLRRPALEHGVDRLAPASGLDCHSLRKAENRLSIL